VKIKKIVEILNHVNAKDINVFDYEGKSPFFDKIIIAIINEKQADAAVSYLKKQELVEIKNIEGSGKSGWILVDAKDIIIHLFKKEEFEYYNFNERLYSLKRISNLYLESNN